MRKFFTLLLAVAFAFPVIAQHKVLTTKAQRDLSVKVQYEKPIKDMGQSQALPSNPSLKSGIAWTETEIGLTKYDLQTNRTVGNRFYRYADGKMAFVWTRGMVETAFSDRGTGYNTFNGTAWGAPPAARIESVRTGWPSYTPTSQGELVVTHTADAMHMAKRTGFGTGAWTESDHSGPAGAEGLTWPRVAASGDNNQYVHIVANTYDPYLGQTSGILYWRSDDGGQSFGTQNEYLPGTDINSYLEVGADEYVWASRGNTIALLVASAWHDLFMLKSDDNGNTWDKTVIWEHPYPFFDWNTTIADTFYCVDNSAAIAIDADGMAHVAFGINKVSHLEVGTTYSYYPYVDGIGYWNEGMARFSSNPAALNPFGFEGGELVENVNLIGWTQDTDGNGQIDFLDQPLSYRSIGVSTMPTIHVDDLGGVYVGWSSTTEGFDNGTLNYKHVWVRTSPDYGVTWGDFTDITGDIFHIFDESIYPMWANTSSNDDVYLVYNADNEPGLALDSDHGYIDNREIVATIAKPEIMGVNNAAKAKFSVSQNHPNPADGLTRFSIESASLQNVVVEVTSITGQTLQSINLGNVNAGKRLVEINTTNLTSGIYFYTVRSGNSSVTKKMVVK
ncbi:MAG: T9SS type A sorting domain-containing protein [Bacteroidales bacterium]|nr:T9SS type A sorting domain-containing protein [Bacteroidales bacterium]